MKPQGADLSEQLKRLGDKLLKQRQAIKPARPTTAKQAPTPVRLILYVYDSTCRNCGCVEQFSNDHLLAQYESGFASSKFAATKYIGPLLSGVPTEIIRQEKQHDYCKHCFGDANK